MSGESGSGNGDAILSQGQKQLFCLARVMLRKSNSEGSASREKGVLLLDEISSSVDKDTDVLMQGLIRTEFSNWTILAVAHRLETIADFDKIVVMDAGRVVDFGKLGEVRGRGGLEMGGRVVE
jgi:ABC-type multidrug transport system fused ATPase/permease subunit